MTEPEPLPPIADVDVDEDEDDDDDDDDDDEADDLLGTLGIADGKTSNVPKSLIDLKDIKNVFIIYR